MRRRGVTSLPLDFLRPSPFTAICGEVGDVFCMNPATADAGGMDPRGGDVGEVTVVDAPLTVTLADIVDVVAGVAPDEDEPLDVDFACLVVDFLVFFVFFAPPASLPSLLSAPPPTDFFFLCDLEVAPPPSPCPPPEDFFFLCVLLFVRL